MEQTGSVLRKRMRGEFAGVRLKLSTEVIPQLTRKRRRTKPRFRAPISVTPLPAAAAGAYAGGTQQTTEPYIRKSQIKAIVSELHFAKMMIRWRL